MDFDLVGQGEGRIWWYKQWSGWMIWEKSLRSNLLMISAMSNAVWVTPRRGAFRDMAFILFLTSAVRWPAKTGSAYVILDMIRPMNSSCSAWTFIPCDFSCDNKYRRWFICKMTKTKTKTDIGACINLPLFCDALNFVTISVLRPRCRTLPTPAL